MADINLVPQEVKKEQKKQSVIKKTTVMSVFVAIATAAVSAYFYTQVVALQGDVASETDKIDALRGEITTLSEIEIAARNLDFKYKALQDVYNTRPYYSKLINEFLARVPETVKIDTFGIGQGNSINISGVGDNYLAIADLVNNLSNTEFEGGNPGYGALFQEVTLNSVSLDSQTNVEAKFFVVLSFNPELLTE